MDKVNKNLDEQARINETLRSMLTEATENLKALTERIGPEFSKDKYDSDMEK